MQQQLWNISNLDLQPRIYVQISTLKTSNCFVNMLKYSITLELTVFIEQEWVSKSDVKDR